MAGSFFKEDHKVKILVSGSFEKPFMDLPSILVFLLRLACVLDKTKVSIDRNARRTR